MVSRAHAQLECSRQPTDNSAAPRPVAARLSMNPSREGDLQLFPAGSRGDRIGQRGQKLDDAHGRHASTSTTSEI
jgi:hypothetical protein